ncbi:hypothetical protein TWF696_001484 [Orbilia brochopaga]|uniref:PLL-like beta propeller domain-containing protein n=1 Tax=Orbilia brochopaga TaxID=3140254 RepID=A0AAV9UD59_9PEZI
MVSLGPNHLDIYVQGMDSNVYHKYWNGNWSGWEKIDGVQTRYDPVVITRPKSSTIDLFIVGYDHCLYHKVYNGKTGWADWNKIGLQCLGPPAVVSRDGNKFLELTYIGTDHALKHKRLEENQQWFPAGTNTIDWGGKYIYNRGSACSWGVNHVSFFNIGLDSRCYEKRWVSGIADWDDVEVPGTWACPPRALSMYEGKMTVFGLTDESQLFYCEMGPAAKKGWAIARVFTDGIYSKEIPEVVCFGRGEERIDVFGVGLDSAIYQKTWKKDSGWVSLNKIGGVTIYAPRVVSWGGTRYDLLSIGTNFACWHLCTNDGDTWLPSGAKWESLDGKMATTAGGKV